jgi:signal transduction histidine kinase
MPHKLGSPPAGGKNPRGRRATDAPAPARERERVDMLAERARHAVAAREEERRRLAAELHDVAGTNLATIKMNLSSIARAIPPSAPHEMQLLLDAQALLTDTIVGIRELCSALRPTVLDHAGLAEALEAHCARFTRRTGIAVALDLAQYEQRCAPDVELTLLRVTQEALWNCAKHAEATQVRISYEQSHGRHRFSIRDNGRGFDPEHVDARGGIGLLSMRERALGVEAAFRLESSPDQGTSIVLDF